MTLPSASRPRDLYVHCITLRPTDYMLHIKGRVTFKSPEKVSIKSCQTAMWFGTIFLRTTYNVAYLVLSASRMAVRLFEMQYQLIQNPLVDGRICRPSRCRCGGDTHSKFLVSFGHEPGCKVIQTLLFSFVRIPFNLIPGTTSFEVLFSNIE